MGHRCGDRCRKLKFHGGGSFSRQEKFFNTRERREETYRTQLTLISRARHYSTLNISEMIGDRHMITVHTNRK